MRGIAAMMLLLLGCPAQSEKPANPLPFDLTLGKKIDEIRADVRKRFGSDEALEHRAEDDSYRSVSYVLETPESGVGINVLYHYRPSDGVVWGIAIANAYGPFTGDLGKVGLDDSLEAIVDKLGKPLARRQEAPVLEKLWWETPEFGYCVDAYSEEYGSNQPGDVKSIEVWRRDLAPPGYDADRD